MQIIVIPEHRLPAPVQPTKQEEKLFRYWSPRSPAPSQLKY